MGRVKAKRCESAVCVCGPGEGPRVDRALSVVRIMLQTDCCGVIGSCISGGWDWMQEGQLGGYWPPCTCPPCKWWVRTKAVVIEGEGTDHTNTPEEKITSPCLFLSCGPHKQQVITRQVFSLQGNRIAMCRQSIYKFYKTLSTVVNKCLSFLLSDYLDLHPWMPVYQAGENGLRVFKKKTLVLIFSKFLPPKFSKGRRIWFISVSFCCGIIHSPYCLPNAPAL